nr:hypothetical protein [uncultured bacterium]
MDPATSLKQALEALNSGREDEAAARLSAEVDALADHPLASAAVGVALLQLGQVEAALLALEQAHYCEPDNAQILFDYGQALERAGRHREARLRFQGVLRLDPDHRPAQRKVQDIQKFESPSPTPAPAPVPAPLVPPAVQQAPPVSEVPPAAPAPASPGSPVPQGPLLPQPAAMPGAGGSPNSGCRSRGIGSERQRVPPLVTGCGA